MAPPEPNQLGYDHHAIVIPGLVPGIHVDGRDKPGHDELRGSDTKLIEHRFSQHYTSVFAPVRLVIRP
jgi:hypothetical protein